MNCNDESISDLDRLREVARILAAGVLRLRARGALTIGNESDDKNLANSDENSLDVCEQIGPCGHVG